MPCCFWKKKEFRKSSQSFIGPLQLPITKLPENISVCFPTIPIYTNNICPATAGFFLFVPRFNFPRSRKVGRRYAGISGKRNASGHCRPQGRASPLAGGVEEKMIVC